jgi:hypothetical protein
VFPVKAFKFFRERRLVLVRHRCSRHPGPSII